MARVQAAHPELRVEEFGGASAGKALTERFEDDFQRAETLSLPITLVILFLAFGALVAALVPLMLGISAVIIAFLCARSLAEDSRMTCECPGIDCSLTGNPM